MIPDDLVDALLEAVNPRVRRNRRRIRSAWSRRIVKTVAMTCSVLRASWRVGRQICEFFTRKRKSTVLCDCGAGRRVIRPKKRPTIYRLDCATGRSY